MYTSEVCTIEKDVFVKINRADNEITEVHNQTGKAIDLIIPDTLEDGSEKHRAKRFCPKRLDGCRFQQFPI